MSDRRIYLAAVAVGLLLSSSYGANPSFVPDTIFKGSALTGWHTLGSAEWRAQNGEITGLAKAGAGWLVLDRSYQDVAVYASLRCAEPCKPGVLLRAETTAGGGMKGILVSLAADDVA